VLSDGYLVLSPSDLTGYLACEHLTQQRLAIARRQRGRPRPADDPHAQLIRDRGDEHERVQLERLSACAGGHVDLTPAGPLGTIELLVAAHAHTVRVMRSGAPLIYQALLCDGGWQGRIDFLRRVEVDSRLGDFAYEVIDTKLARSVKPQYVHQLAVYSRLVAGVQGIELPSAVVLLGDGSEARIELNRFAALHRYLVRRLEATVRGAAVDIYPEPVAHCAVCAFAAECRARIVADDHLSLVAGARRDQRKVLVELGLGTVAQLVDASELCDTAPLGAERFSILHHQAALQVDSRDSGRPAHRHLAFEPARGYARLPEPSPGDIFFDLEGDPYVGIDGGIEYLWGWWTVEHGYEHVWAHDPAAEKAALERLIDRVNELRRAHPGMHVYHYAAHERSKLTSLAMNYATREVEVDQLLRSDVLVDLYAVVRQGIQVGEESYGLKKLERHHQFRRLEHRVRDGGGSIVAYEIWLQTGEQEILESIRAYNEEDCRSTLSLRDWLWRRMLPEAELEFGRDIRNFRDPEHDAPHPPPAWLSGVQELVDRLLAGLGADGADDDADQAERRTLAHLLLYHYRESKPEWWRHFAMRELTLEELAREPDAVAWLQRDRTIAPTPVKQSLDYAFTFPPQEVRLHSGDLQDPTTGQGYTVVAVDEEHVVIRRGNTKEPPTPIALVDGPPIGTTILRHALEDIVIAVLNGDCPKAVRALLRREAPRLTSGELREDIESLIGATLGLDRSVLAVQGPPGTGKTYRGAHVIAAALKAGLRVGITALSHAAIKNMLRDVERCAHLQGVAVNGVYKGHAYTSEHELIEVVEGNNGVTKEYNIVAGTAWLFCRHEHREKFDLLVIDEAGQLSLAHAVGAATAARNVLLLGDPQQLPQVTQAVHPESAGASVLEHMLDGSATIAPGRGVLLTESWRMHPDVCAFVSEQSYEGKLRSRPDCARRRIDAPAGELLGAGLRVIAVETEGRSQAAVEEALAIAQACRHLLRGGRVTDEHGMARELTADDLMVVTPYNLAARCVAERVPEGVRVGTVDLFQGQEAAVVFFAMTASSGEDAPRGIDFLFNANRLNVAVSRAQCLAVLVHSPRLLDADCHTLEAMEVVNGVCRYVEMAREQAPDTKTVAARAEPVVASS
jgi:predicted RecB family nuclease